MFTRAKKLSEWLFIATKNANKLYRWSIIDKLLNSSLNLINLLYLANSHYLPNKRLKYQKQANAELMIISHLMVTGKKLEVFTIKQLDFASGMLLETRNSLWAWITTNPAHKEEVAASRE